MTKIIKDSGLNKLFGGEFELIHSGFSDGQYNMDFDSERTRAVAEGTALPMFRFYGWKPWAVSLGYNQKEGQIDGSLCREKGFDIVRRPTGGRAVLHADELTYSVVMNVPQNLSVHDIYRLIHIVLLQGMRQLGAEGLGFEKAQADLRSFYQKSAMSVSCFASSARYEIESDGRKIVGSAQRLFGKTLLQHGSILLGSGHEQLSEVATLETDDERQRLREFMLSHSISLSEVCNRKIGYDEAVEAMTDAVSQ